MVREPDWDTKEQNQPPVEQRQMMARLCGVCEAHESKYKCPQCRIAYCSAACYKRHKETPCEKPTTTTTTTAATTTVNDTTDATTQSQQTAEDEELDPSSLLSLESLEQLQTLEFVKQELRNPHYRAMLTQIHQSANPKKELEKAMLDPAFASFMYQMLDAIKK